MVGPCDFSVTPVSIGLGYWTGLGLGLGQLDLGLGLDKNCVIIFRGIVKGFQKLIDFKWLSFFSGFNLTLILKI